MSQKTEISLRNFFIYNSKFGPKEGEVSSSQNDSLFLIQITVFYVI